ncbi:MAG: 50S ribosomal protein L21e [Desulfurococcales archaeon]|nr:50S ribosomal protein L21e [Desulfurococcales archaeon]
MVKAPRGFRHRTRKLFKKHVRDKGGVPPISLLLHDYNVGDKVHIIINSAIHKGMPHRRYHGKTAVIVGKRGKAYLVSVTLGNKKKLLVIRPEHLRPAKN